MADGVQEACVLPDVRSAQSGGRDVTGLRLSKLTLAGFKSFADRTEIAFDDDLTGIVGPNGCGKSNVVDAIKWVLGERSSKSLRGKEMLDVIFAGSAGRKPGGMAAVTLTFDNPRGQASALPRPGGADGTEGMHPTHDEHVSDAEADEAAEEGASEAAAIITAGAEIRRPLPIDADTVEVERRLYRDGKSQYLINGKLARLRDIRDLFLDTGIGADAYSIIEQGKVDRMLLASPQERRSIFEEAAGIAKYRQRRVEAERKLERAEHNLVRTREQLDGTERRLRLVKGQAAKARRYQELRCEHDALRLALSFESYDDIRQRLDGLTSRLASLEAERARTQEALEAVEDARREAEVDRHEAGAALRRVEDELTGARHARASADQRRLMAVRSIEEAATQVETETRRLREASEALERLGGEIESQRTGVAGLAERQGQAERRLEEASEARAAVIEQIGEQRRALDEIRGRMTQIERERTGLEAQARADERRIESLREQLASVEAKQATRRSEGEALDAQVAASERSIADRGAEVASLERRLEAKSAEEDSLGADRRALGERVGRLDQEFVRLDARRATLAEMVESRVGLGEATRAVLARHDAGSGFAGVVGSLAELVETDAAHACAIEAALGPDLQAIVVDSIASMPAASELAELPGRVALIPLDGGRPEPGHPSGADIERMTGGRVTALRRFVRQRGAGDRLAGLLDRLLGHTVLVEDLDAALLLSAGPMRTSRTRYVTRNGSVLEPDGRVIAGPASSEESSGILARRSELDALEASLRTLGATLEEERRALASADAEAARIERERMELASALAERQRRLVGEQTRLEKLLSDRTRVQRESAALAGEGEQTEARIDGIETDRRALVDKAGSLERLHRELSEQAGTLADSLDAGEQRKAAAGEQMTAARVEASKIDEQLRAARRELGRLEGERDASETRRAEAERHVSAVRGRLGEHERTVHQAEAESSEATRLADELAREVESAQTAHDETQRRVSALAERVVAARKAAEIIQRDWHSIETSRRELEVKRENLEERTLEDVDVDLANEYLDYRAMIGQADVERIDVPDAQARVNVLKGEIGKLGNVNLNAIEEEEQLAERNEELIAQVKDLDEARIRLATLIEKLNIASRERFGAVFETIRAHFGGKDGMFRKLFGGGRAEVRLMGLVKEVEGQKVITDEVDLLESGIEVIAKPPGKEPRSISQLSGGEKTLTAVALLLSIFRSKPSCFCVLDEVDAALDEANVGRFSRVIQEFTDQSRFIVITHNKRTMQGMNRLYGITMQERGVSKRVSVQFDQVGANGHIDVKAARGPTPEPAHDDTHDDPAPTDAETTPAAPSPTGGLRQALASMRDEDRAAAGP